MRAQIVAAGGEPARVFTDEALGSIYRASDGIPRLINQVCDHALILASLGGVRPVTGEVIDEAWADLQQLPAPWSGGRAAAGESRVVEFGRLDEPRDGCPRRFHFVRREGNRCTWRPDEQLDAIEQQLSSIVDDFRPAGAILSEVDLDFPEFGDPFSEEFADEEVVLDRYRSDIEMFARAQRVSSREGSQLGSMLDSLATATVKEPKTAEIMVADPAVEWRRIAFRIRRRRRAGSAGGDGRGPRAGGICPGIAGSRRGARLDHRRGRCRATERRAAPRTASAEDGVSAVVRQAAARVIGPGSVTHESDG